MAFGFLGYTKTSVIKKPAKEAGKHVYGVELIVSDVVVGSK